MCERGGYRFASIKTSRKWSAGAPQNGMLLQEVLMTEEFVPPPIPGSGWAVATRSALLDALLIGALVFSFSLLGILTRPAGALAAFWPANAVLLGVLVRRVRKAGWLTWCGAAAGFILADGVMGGAWPKVGWLSLANMTGVMVGYLLFSRVPCDHRRLRQPLSVVYLIVIVAIASLAAGLVGMLINPLLFQGAPVDGLLIWFTAELVDYLVILPVILTMPAWRGLGSLRRKQRRRGAGPRMQLLTVAPALTLFLGGVLGMVISGPGAVSYLVPGLLWCALAYSLFVTAVLTLLCSVWTLMAVSVGFLHLGSDFEGRYALQSFRIGVALMVLAPLAVASVMAARNELLRQLQHTVAHDRLTGVLNRSGFMDRADALFRALPAGDRPFAALMLDIDHFKKVNDQHGHAAGDQVLAGFALLVGRCLRDTDVLGRMGGEEFAVLLPDSSPAVAQAVAQRICDACAAHATALADGTQLVTTVSIGVAHAPAMPVSLDALLSAADGALYRAKQAGRNRVVMGNASA